MTLYTEEEVFRYLYHDITINQEIPFSNNGYVTKGNGNKWSSQDKYQMDIENYWRQKIRETISYNKFKTLIKIHLSKDLKGCSDKSLEHYFTLYRRNNISQPLLTSMFHNRNHYETKNKCWCF